MARRNPWILTILGSFAIGCVVGAGVWAYWSYANQPPSYTPARVVMPVPNAYDDYRLAGALCKQAGGPVVRNSNLKPQSGNSWPRLGFDPDVPLEQVRAVVVRNRPALARLRQGFRKVYRSPPMTSPGQPLPEFANLRELARVLLTEGKLAEREDRMGDAARSYLDCLRLGVDVPRGGTLIHALVGSAIQEIGLRSLERAVDRMDASTAAAAAREMVRLDQAAPAAAEILAVEKEYGTAMMVETLRQRMSWRDLAAMVSRGSSSAPSAHDYLMALKFSFTPKRQILVNYRSYMDALIASARKPYYARRALPPLPNDPLNQMVLPAFDLARFKWALNDALWRIVELRLAVRAYQLRHGAPPPSPGVLAPEYLPSVPRDPFANKPLVYRLQGSRPILYSRGPDGDDDGGRDLGYPARPGQDGDIVSTEIPRRNFGPGN